MKLAVCDFNREPLHNRSGKSVEGFNMRRKETSALLDKGDRIPVKQISSR